MKKTKPWTDQEIETAKKLFENAKASNRLKQRRVLAVSAGLSGGPTRTAWYEVTWRDYLLDARKGTKDGNGSPMAQQDRQMIRSVHRVRVGRLFLIKKGTTPSI